MTQNDKTMEQPSTDMEISKIKANIDEIKKSADEIKIQIENFDKEKDALTEELKEQKQKEIEEKKLEIGKKRKETQELIRNAKALEKFKTNITSQEELDGLEKELASIESTAVKRNRIQRQRDGATSKEERKEHTLTNIARVAGGIGAVALARKGIKRMFGMVNNEEQRTEKKEEKTETKSRWNKILLWAGIGTGGILVRHNRDTIKSRFTGNKAPKEKFKKDFSTEEKEKTEKFKKEVQKTIEETNASEYDFKDQRGEIKFDTSKEPDYKIQSRGKETTIGFDIKQGKYKIADLDIRFTDLKELVWAANLTNRFLRKYGGKKTFWNTRGLTNNFIYREDHVEGDGIYYSGYIKNTFRILKKSTLEKYCKGRKKNHMESYVEYLNKVTK